MKHNEQEGAAARWAHVARSNNYTCLRCGEYPPYEERELFFETKLCGWCSHQTDKSLDD